MVSPPPSSKQVLSTNDIWFRIRDNLGLIKSAREIGELAGEVKNSGGVVFVTGLYVPFPSRASVLH